MQLLLFHPERNEYIELILTPLAAPRFVRDVNGPPARRGLFGEWIRHQDIATLIQTEYFVDNSFVTINEEIWEWKDPQIFDRNLEGKRVVLWPMPPLYFDLARGLYDNLRRVAAGSTLLLETVDALISERSENLSSLQEIDRLREKERVWASIPRKEKLELFAKVPGISTLDKLNQEVISRSIENHEQSLSSKPSGQQA